MSLLKNLAKLGIIGIIKTNIFNFRYMPLSQAFHLPILLSSKVKVVNMRRNGNNRTEPIKENINWDRKLV